MIPKTLNGWLSWIVGVGLAVMAAYMLKIGEAPPMWAVLLNAALSAVALAMRGGGVDLGTAKKPPVASMVAIVGILGAITLSGCPNAYRAGWVATAALVDARDATDDGISRAFRADAKKCMLKHDGDVPAIRKCTEDTKSYKAAIVWQGRVLPAVNTSIRVSKATLEIAEKTQASKDSTMTKVLNALKDGVCKLLPVLDDWKDQFSESVKAALVYVKMIKVVCK